MKRQMLFFISLVFAWCLLNTSCGKNDDVNPDPKEEPKEEPTGPLCSVSSISFDSSKDAGLIIINTKKNWAVTVDVPWISFTKESETGKTGILIGASPNPGFKRQGKVTITAGTDIHEITVKQQGASVINVALTSEIKLSLVLVEGGSFLMGNANNTVHQVTLDTFYISNTEITNAQWQAVMSSLPYELNNKTNEPISSLSWTNVNNDFMPAIKTKTGINFRLPTEAEWEFAAIGGRKSKAFVFSGSNDLDEVAWHGGNSLQTKKNVGQKKANELGIYDMSGNVAEWCSDCFAYYTSASVTNPKGPDTGTERIIRGGNYSSTYQIFGSIDCDPRQRVLGNPTAIYENTGFRVVVTP